MITASHNFDEKGRIGVPMGFKGLKIIILITVKPQCISYCGFGVMQVMPVLVIGFDNERNKLS